MDNNDLETPEGLKKHYDSLIKYDPAQPRDEKGRWTADGAGAANATDSHMKDQLSNKGLKGTLERTNGQQFRDGSYVYHAHPSEDVSSDNVQGKIKDIVSEEAHGRGPVVDISTNRSYYSNKGTPIYHKTVFTPSGETHILRGTNPKTGEVHTAKISPHLGMQTTSYDVQHSKREAGKNYDNVLETKNKKSIAEALKHARGHMDTGLDS